MKINNFEKKKFIIFITLMLLLLEISFFIYLSLTKIYQYKKISGIVLKDDHLILILDAKERKILYKNTFFYINSKKKKYLIKEDKGVIITKDNKKYYELLIKIDFDKKYNFNDSIDLSIKTKKVHLIEMFKIIWDGG